jgi:hypothetical protein
MSQAERIPPDAFLPAPNGNHDFGEINAVVAGAIGCDAGPICLQQGYPTEKGFGRLHIESHAQRMKQIRGLGYATVEAFVYAVAQNYTIIQDGGNGRLILIHKRLGHDLRIVVTKILRSGKPHWNVVTGLPYRESRRPVLYVMIRSDGSEPTPGVAEKRPRFATLSLPKKK